MMGISIGNIGMLYDDFLWLDMEEFDAIVEAWQTAREDEQKAEWERMRMLASICISPHLKHAPTPQKLLPFPWEKKRPKVAAPKISKEDARKRFEEMVRREKGITNA